MVLPVLLLLGLWTLIHFSGVGEEAEELPSEPALGPNFVERSDPAEVERSVDSAVRGFMTAGCLEERARFVVGGVGTLSLMKSYYERSGAVLPNGCAEIPDQMSSVQKGELLLASRGIDQDGQSNWFSLVSCQDRVLIDWESTVGYGEIPWAEFVSERPEKEVLMRVYLLRFIDEKDRDLPDPPYFYRVMDRSKSSSVIAVPERGSEVEGRLAALIPAGKTHPVMVRLRFREGQSFAQISELVHDLMGRFRACASSPSGRVRIQEILVRFR